MVIKRGDLIDFGGCETHLARERGKVGRRDVAVAVLDPVEVLDEEITPPRLASQQRLHLGQRLRVDCATLGEAARFAAGLPLHDTAFQLFLLTSARILRAFPSPPDCGSP